MKNLAILILVICSATSSKAQFVQSTAVDSILHINLAKQDLILNIPMLGNVTIKNASYAFQEATMPFQIDPSELNIVNKEAFEIDSTNIVRTVRQRKSNLTATNTEKRL